MSEAIPKIYTAAQVADWLKVSLSFVRSHAEGRRRPFMKSIKMGRTRRFRESDVLTFIEDCEQIENGRRKTA
jgi:excisionase family DNA binding protein